VDSEGLPHCRTVVFRGFLPVDGDGYDNCKAMKMITDLRSEKVEQISHSPACEMVWWFSETSEQFRLSGNLRLVTSSDTGPLSLARTQQWSALSDMAREQFFWRSPGKTYEGLVSVPAGGRDDSTGKVLPPPENFALLLLFPHKVKYLRLSDNLSIVDSVLPSGGWDICRVNP
jgi:hypothetical protein